MEGSGVAAITGRTLTVGGHQIEKISSATQHHAGRSTASARAISITLEQTPANPPVAANALHNRVHVPPQA